MIILCYSIIIMGLAAFIGHEIGYEKGLYEKLSLDWSEVEK